MKDVGSKTAHEHTGVAKEPVLPFKSDIRKPGLPPRLDIRPGDEQNDLVAYTAKITLGKRIPRNGPRKPHMRDRITWVILLVWVMWVVFGAIRLTLTGDSTMLLASPVLLLVPLVAVLRYYFSKKRRNPRRKAKYSQKPSRSARAR
jgi:hypothetical protein